MFLLEPRDGTAGRPSLVGRRLTEERDVPLLRAALSDAPWWTQDPVVVDGWEFTAIRPRDPLDGGGAREPSAGDGSRDPSAGG